MNTDGTEHCIRCGAPINSHGMPCPACHAPGSAGSPQHIPGNPPPSQSRFTTAKIVVATLALVGLVAGLAVVGLGIRSDDSTEAATGPSSTTTTTTTEPEPTPLTPAELVQVHAPAVWRVDVAGCLEEGHGSAWAIDSRHLVTNAHVVAIDSQPTLVSRDGKEISGTVIGRSDDLDIAVIEADTDLPATLDWASTDDLGEGQEVLGLGYPLTGDFAATPGSIVSFLTDENVRVAVRTDAALDFGNSGGPLLTGDGRVAGVTTLVVSAGIQSVPHAFTQAALASTVDGMIAAPTAVEQDCGDLLLPTAPEPPPEVPSYTPPPMPEPLPIPTTTTVPCPTGRPTVTVDRAIATQDMPEYSPEYWTIEVSGTVRNDTSANIRVGTIDVHLAGDPSPHMAFTDSYELRPGHATTFSTRLYVTSAGEPGGATASLDGWSWADWDHYGCGTV